MLISECETESQFVLCPVRQINEESLLNLNHHRESCFPVYPTGPGILHLTQRRDFTGAATWKIGLQLWCRDPDGGLQEDERTFCAWCTAPPAISSSFRV